ncbi:SRPBCC family protein [Streptomyces sp. NPDC046931]|uniref:SRPBCC family protein n=1 Tax=Streptomyces sp. NPDC046931 TaxID=3154806 RepID=UPI00340689EB
MTEGVLSKVREQAKQNPATDRLKQELEEYLRTRLEVAVGDLGERLGEGARRLADTHVGPGMLTGLVLKGGKKLLGGGLLGGGQEEGAGGLLSKAKDTVLGKAQEAAGGRHEKRPSGVAKGLMIIEDVNVGVPVREAYNQWTQFTEFDRFTKGVENVEQDDEISSRWQFRIAKVRRRYRGIVTEEVPDERIAWNSEGAKGTTKGVVTFHPLGDQLTKVLLCMQYFPKGLFERVGSLWRAQGRRARLDLKLYRAFIMERGEATGAWRGEIREGEVVRSPEEVEEAEQEERDREERERGRGRDEDEELYPEDEEEEEEEGEEGEEPEERYEDEEEEEDDEGEEEGREEDEGDEDEFASEESDEGDREEDEEPEDRYDETEEEAPQRRRRRG